MLLLRNLGDPTQTKHSLYVLLAAYAPAADFPCFLYVPQVEGGDKMLILAVLPKVIDRLSD